MIHLKIVFPSKDTIMPAEINGKPHRVDQSQKIAIIPNV